MSISTKIPGYIKLGLLVLGITLSPLTLACYGSGCSSSGSSSSSRQPSAGRGVTNLTRPDHQPRQHRELGNNLRGVPETIKDSVIHKQDVLSVEIPGQSEPSDCNTINCSDDGPPIGLTMKPSDGKWKTPKTKVQLLKERIDKLRKENREVGDGKTLREQIVETDYRIATIRVRQDKIDDLINDTEEGREYLKGLKEDNDNISVNPYGDGRSGTKAATKGGSFAATRLLVKNPTPTGIIAGFVLDGVEAGFRKKFKSDTEDALDDYIKNNKKAVSGLNEVHSALSADLNVEITRKKALKTKKAEIDQLEDEWATAALKEQKTKSRAAENAVRQREQDKTGDIEARRKYNKDAAKRGISRSSGPNRVIVQP